MAIITKTIPQPIIVPNPNSIKITPQQDTLTMAVNLNSQLNIEIKKIRREYQTRILQLQNQLTFLTEQVTYKQQAHSRELENLKAVLQYEYTVKIRDIKNKLREQYEGFLMEGVGLKDRNKFLEEEVRLFKIKYQRSEKYNKQVEVLAEDRFRKECEGFQAKVQHLQKQMESLKQNLTKQHNQELKQQKIQIQKQKQQITELQQKLKQKEDKIQQLTNQIQQLAIEVKKKIVEKQQLRIDKDKLIEEQEARILVLREETVLKELRDRKDNRNERLKQIDENISKQYQATQRKQYKTIDAFKTDMQKQILLQKQMKKRWQTQTYNKPQIRKVTVRKRSSTNDVSMSDSCSKKNSLIVDSPRFGIQTRLNLDYY